MYTGHWMESVMHYILKPYKISSQQYNILRILQGSHPEPLSIKELQLRMLDKMSNASRLVEKLRLKRLVKRKQSADDRRTVQVTITEAGSELIEKIYPKIKEVADSLRKLEEEDIKKMNNLLDELRSQ